MTDFDQRWQTLAAAARASFHEAREEPPFGLATAAVARWQAAPAEPWEDILGALGRRAILALACVCLVSAGVAYFSWQPSTLERPLVERAASPDYWFE
jgi:hypothetical protein